MPTPEATLVQGMTRSRYWRYLREYLIQRREALLAERCETTEQLWRNKGATDEVTTLLRAPELLLAYFRSQSAAPAGADARETPPTPAVPPWLGVLAGDDVVN